MDNRNSWHISAGMSILYSDSFGSCCLLGLQIHAVGCIICILPCRFLKMLSIDAKTWLKQSQLVLYYYSLSFTEWKPEKTQTEIQIYINSPLNEKTRASLVVVFKTLPTLSQSRSFLIPRTVRQKKLVKGLVWRCLNQTLDTGRCVRAKHSELKSLPPIFGCLV